MPGISKETIDRIRAAANIVEIIGSYVPLKRAGKEYRALSPFNKEKTPSFYVDPVKGLFKCFSSGHGGDVFKFIMLYENVDFPAAVRLLAQRLGIPVEESSLSPQEQEKTQLRDTLLRLHSDVAAYWSHLLHNAPEAKPARDYLTLRRIPLSLAREFSLGFSLPLRDHLLTWAKQKGYPISVLRLSGLFAENEQSKQLYDRFRNRLTIPIFNESGQPIAFSARLISQQDNAPKYLNSPDTPLFQKGQTLFGLHKAKRSILETGFALLCEGPLDLIRCHQYGFTNSVATQGTAFSENQARLLRRFTQEIVLCFDSDRAGESATLRSLEILLSLDFDVRIVTLPQGHDPDSFLSEHPPDTFQQLISNAPHYIDHFTNKILTTFPVETPQGRAQATDALLNLLRHVTHPVKREAYTLTLAARLQIPQYILLERLKALPPSPTPPPHTSNLSEANEITLHPVVEHLTAFLLAYPEYCPHLARLIPQESFDFVTGGHLLRRLLELHSQDLWDTPESLMHLLTDEAEKNTLARLALRPPDITPNAHDPYFHDLILQLKRQILHYRISILEQEIKSQLLSPQALSQKTKELLDSRRALANLLRPKP
ncbi:MAG: DNA primase [Verrucomicrobiae bacterium]|nr:DNA primase [Verrucomicrobiae bacterium]